MKIKLFNSLTRKIEVFKPINPPKVGMYACGPTVYSFISIGNWRTNVLGDIILRILKYLDFKPTYIMNITDVGHLTGDNLGDADVGEDKMEKAAKRENKTAWDIAKFYTNDFLKGYNQLNLTKPKRFTKATDYIKEQIELVKKIEKKGLSYKISDGIYFDVKAWENKGGKYGELSTLDERKEGVRVKRNIEKKDKRDFALWKFSKHGEARQMEWVSPWAPPGVRGKVKGFPGWHLECSAMSMKYLGEQFDIHLGGEDLKSTHHPNEIAQSEAASGKKPFVRYWIHGAFLLVDGRKMSKSFGNVYNLNDLWKKGFDPLSLRYFYITGHYRKQLNFTFEALKASQKAYFRLKDHIREFKKAQGRKNKILEQTTIYKKYKRDFKQAISSDFNMPVALAVLWQVVKSKLSNKDKLNLLLDFDKVFGLNLDQINTKKTKEKVDKKIIKQVAKREKLRAQKKWQEADKIRKDIEKQGFLLKDTNKRTKVIRKVNGFGK